MNHMPLNNESTQQRAARLLIVDDDRDILDALEAMLELDEGKYLIRTVENSNDAMAVSRDFLPDLVLLDIKLGRESGLDLIPQLRQFVPDLACIMMTAFRDPAYAVKAVQQGANDYLHKPLHVEELQRALENQVRLQSEGRFREQIQRRFQAVFEQSHQFLYMLDPAGRLLDFNSSVRNGLGCEDRCFIGKPVWTLDCWRELGEERFSAMIGAMREGQVVETELRLVGQSQIPRSFAFSFKPILNPAGELEMILAEGLDITERVKAEAFLRNSNEILEQKVRERTALMVEAQRIGHMGNWKWTVASGEIAWSDEIFHIFGYQPGEFQPTYERFLAMVHPDDLEGVRQSEQEAFERQGRHSIDHRIVLPSGETRWVHEEAVVEKDANGNAMALIGTVQDITQRKQNEQALTLAKDAAEFANQAKSEFLARMSHELRTPMNAILGFSQVLELESLSQEQHMFINEISKAGAHLLELINELLDLSRIEAGRLPVFIEPVSLDAVAEQVTCLFKPLQHIKDVTLHCDCAKGLVALADPIRLKQIMLNLLSNAAKYNRQGGKIELRCEKLGDNRVRLLVRDEGKGIAEDKLEHIFTPFERLGAEFSDVEGTGIGLALSLHLAELMGGELGFETKLGTGSSFWVDLPLAEQLAVHENSLQPIVAPMFGDKARVLYIEDNVANLRLVEAIFSRQKNLTLLPAVNGESGLELARRYQPEVILLDIHLPGMDGFAVLEVLKNDPATCHIPVIALSADAMPIDVERAMAAGFNAYLTKPVKLDQLLEAVHASLKNPVLPHG